MANVSKYKTTTFQPGAIHTGIPEEAFRRRIKGKGGTYQEHMRRRIPCPDCGVELAARSMTAHHRRLHGTEPEIEWDQLPVIQTEHLPLMYEFRFLTNIQSCQCTFPGCPGMPWSRSGLQNHFSRLHWGDIILKLEEHPTTFPHCERCNQQVPPWLMNNIHYNTKVCRQGQYLQR